MHNPPTQKKYLELRTEIIKWMPKNIINAHTHLNPHLNINYETLNNILFIKKFSQKNLLYSYKYFNKIFPTKKILQLFIPLPFFSKIKDIDFINNSLIKNINNHTFGCLLATKINLLEKTINKAKKQNKKFNAIKFHPTVHKINFISEYFDKKTLNFCKKNNLTILCELPNGWRKKDIKIIDQITKNHKLKIVVPHLGLNNMGFCYTKKQYIARNHSSSQNIKNQFQKIKKLKNLFLDTSMITDQRIINAAFDTLNEDQLIWGDDFPFSLTPKIQEYRPESQILANDLYALINNGKTHNPKWFYYINIFYQLKLIKNYYGNNKFSKNKLFYENAKKTFNI